MPPGEQRIDLPFDAADDPADRSAWPANVLQAGTAAAVPAAAALVATETGWSGERAVPCPSAPLLAGELRRRGLSTISGPMRLRLARPGDPVVYVLHTPACMWAMAVATARTGQARTTALCAMRAWAAVAHRLRTVQICALDSRHHAAMPEVALIADPAAGVRPGLAAGRPYNLARCGRAHRVDAADAVEPKWVSAAASVCVAEIGAEGSHELAEAIAVALSGVAAVPFVHVRDTRPIRAAVRTSDDHPDRMH
jgi:hypothetical protein